MTDAKAAPQLVLADLGSSLKPDGGASVWMVG